MPRIDIGKMPRLDVQEAYKGSDKQCGVCESCMRRKRAFKNLGINDESEYEI